MNEGPHRSNGLFPPVKPASGQAKEDAAPIFIVGYGRSGTTLLELMLSAHPRIFIAFETNFYALPFRGYSLEEWVRAFFKTGGGAFLRLEPESILRNLPEEVPVEERWKIFREIMKQRAAKYGRVRYGDKSPPHSKRLRRIFRDFPQARVILITRDPRSAVVSTMRMPWGSSRILANCLTYESTYKKTRPFRDRILHVRLEDLQRDPRRAMERILAFVDEEWDEAVLDHAANNPDPIPVPPLPWLESSNAPVRNDASPGWQSLPAATIRVIEYICRQSMAAYGYEPADLGGAEPSRFDVVRQIASDLPETVRYFAVLARFGIPLRKLENWDFERWQAGVPAINPSCWKYYPGFKWPSYADLLALEKAAPAQKASQ